MINVKKSKNNFGKISSILATITVVSSFPSYGIDSPNSFLPSEKTDVNLLTSKVKTLIESTWEDGVTQDTIDHLYRIQSYVKNQLSQLSSPQQTDLKDLLEINFLLKVEDPSQPNKFESIFRDYLNNLFDLPLQPSSVTPPLPLSSPPKTKRPRASSIIFNEEKQKHQFPQMQSPFFNSLFASFNSSTPTVSSQIEQGAFTFITSPSQQEEITNYRSVKQTSYVDQENNIETFDYAKLETPVLFIKAANEKVYIAYDVSKSLSLIKLKLLKHYKITFLPNLEGKNVEFEPTEEMIDLGNGEKYPFAKIKFPPLSFNKN
ncbi:hypothetical protein [Candidatus Odyssella acanthamoebae]|uniref:Uncharacterized protein n=1 Tax=Candidatus Odyssella acanthamoebae TaxID=91604 RepID=A0A077AVJ2_9PROT|nr:hypothetical protein [Candidatus Paracaedibacter acanthamoebae]AIK96059.1 hypothetical protein ID47_03810 [Candidatus Paracaedibacter acanthamoebae]